MTKVQRLSWAVGALTVVVVGLIAYGVLTHEEPGLLQVCWQPSGIAKGYIGGGDLGSGCEDGDVIEPVRWMPSDFPVGVMVIVYRGDTDDAVATTRAAIEAINDQLRFEALTLDGTPEARIGVAWGGHLAHSGGACVHRRRGEQLEADIAIANVATSRWAYLVAMHELLHALGLAHDRHGVMRPRVTEPDGWIDVNSSWINRKDRKLLRNLYAL